MNENPTKIQKIWIKCGFLEEPHESGNCYVSDIVFDIKFVIYTYF
jgi:hypothetical protein